MRYSPIWVFQFNQHVHTRLLSRPFLLKIVHERKYLCRFMRAIREGQVKRIQALISLDRGPGSSGWPKLRGLFTEFILTSSSNVSSFLAPRGPASTYCNNWRDTRSKCRSRHGQLMGGVVRVRESQVRLAMDIIITDNL
ncbi:mRNA export factor MEX67 [Fusarium oxysporum f. sp. albedinis]|nr:mRNA export factor MEX67 [Fusarium oxysporum f. sp. albedinis]